MLPSVTQTIIRSVTPCAAALAWREASIAPAPSSPATRGLSLPGSSEAAAPPAAIAL